MAAFPAELVALEQTELYQLKTKVIEAKEVGQDLLADMAHELDEQINVAMAKLEQLKSKFGL